MICGSTCTYTVCEVIVGGGGGVSVCACVCTCACVHVCVCECACSPVCVHGTREQLRKRETKRESYPEKSPHYGFEPVYSLMIAVGQLCVYP